MQPRNIAPTTKDMAEKAEFSCACLSTRIALKKKHVILACLVNIQITLLIPTYVSGKLL